MKDDDDDLFPRRDPEHVCIFGLFADGACARMIEKIEALGPASAPITTPYGFVHRPDVRNNDRVIFDDGALAATLFEGVRAHVPARIHNWTPIGCNERFRAYRYGIGQRFAPHHDGAFVRNADERSWFTLLVYLNEGFGGGETAFLDHVVTPSRGMGLLFPHPLLHEGRAVTRGLKYVLRTDVMYRRAG